MQSLWADFSVESFNFLSLDTLEYLWDLHYLKKVCTWVWSLWHAKLLETLIICLLWTCRQKNRSVGDSCDLNIIPANMPKPRVVSNSLLCFWENEICADRCKDSIVSIWEAGPCFEWCTLSVVSAAWRHPCAGIRLHCYLISLFLYWEWACVRHLLKRIYKLMV